MVGAGGERLGLGLGEEVWVGGCRRVGRRRRDLERTASACREVLDLV